MPTVMNKIIQSVVMGNTPYMKATYLQEGGREGEEGGGQGAGSIAVFTLL